MMRRSLFVVLFAALSASCVGGPATDVSISRGVPDQPPVEAAPQENDPFYGFKPYNSPLFAGAAASPRGSIDAFFAKQRRDFDADNPSFTIHPTKLNDRQVLQDLFISGIGDDSITAEQYRMLVVKRDGRWHVARAGTRHRCGRGPDTGSWVTGLCP